MNRDQQIILAAYDDAIKSLYSNLFDGYVAADGDAAQEQQADRRFTTGISLARSSRDRAVALAA